MIYLDLLCGGAFLCLSLPHLISGLRGERFFTPWSTPRRTGRSSPLENVLWGSVNLLIAVYVFTHTADQNAPHGLIAAALGFVLVGIAQSISFGRRTAG